MRELKQDTYYRNGVEGLNLRNLKKDENCVWRTQLMELKLVQKDGSSSKMKKVRLIKTVNEASGRVVDRGIILNGIHKKQFLIIQKIKLKMSIFILIIKAMWHLSLKRSISTANIGIFLG